MNYSISTSIQKAKIKETENIQDCMTDGLPPWFLLG